MRKTYVVTLILCLFLAISALAADTLNIYFIDVGQGDAILIDYGEYEMLIDGGPDGSCVAFLRDYVDGPLEVIVATHPHSDHIGGLDDVLRAFDVQKVLTNGSTSGSSTFSNFTAAVAAERRSLTVVRRNDKIPLGDLELAVLHPYEIVGDANDDSIVLLLSYGSVSLLFTGDITCDVEQELMDQGCLFDINVLKVAHHGSTYGTCEEFLHVVKPEIAVYSAGVGNRYGHPATATIDRLEDAGVLALGTDHQGSIAVSTDGSAVHITINVSVVPTTGSLPPSVTRCESCVAALNEATKYEFAAIPGVGDAKAQALVDSQPFAATLCTSSAIEAVLDDVPGIGETLCKRIARYFCPELYGE